MSSKFYEIKSSNIPGYVMKKIKCKTDHYLFDQHAKLPYGVYCKKCADSIYGKDFFEVFTTMPSTYVKNLIENYSDDIQKELFEKIHKNAEYFESEKINDEIDNKFGNIEFELDIRIESIIAGLHEYREEFMKEMEVKKASFKSSIKTIKFKEIHEELNEISRKETTSFDYDGLKKLQEHISNARSFIDEYYKTLNKIEYESNQKIIFKDLIGYLKVPIAKNKFFYDDEVIKVKDAYDMKKFCIQSNGNLFLINNCSLICYQKNYESKDILYPVALCTGRRDQLIVVDGFKDPRVLIFSKYLRFKKEFRITGSAIDRITADPRDERNLIYVSHRYANEIKIWDCDDGKLIRTVRISSPSSIAFKNGKIFIVSHSDFETNSEGHLKNTTSGLNCIFVLNKSDYEITDEIKFDDWLQPHGLGFDESDNLMTIAYEMHSDRTVSDDLYLHVINKDKEVIQKLRVNNNKPIRDIICNKKGVFLLFDDFIINKKMKIYF